MSNSNNRRNFLKNTSLAALSIGVIPQLTKAANVEEKKPDEDLFIGCVATTEDYYGEGPFYTENPPTIENNQLATKGETGTKLTISGRVLDINCSEYLENTIIDVWHADDSGSYDNEGYNLRGQLTTNSEGFYLFETILPGKYLNGGSFRPSHIHFKITPPNSETLTTQLYFSGDEDIPGDAAASVTSGIYNASSRIINLIEAENGDLDGYWDIVINGDDSNSINDLHLNKGIIYKTHPNPFTESITIDYGVFKAARVSLMVFNLQGEQVAVLDEKNLKPEKYSATWKPESGLADGHYFISLKINDLQVHYMKVLKQSAY